MIDKATLSVLMAFYDGDSSEKLHRALYSLKIQTVPAAEIVLVQDGPVRRELLEVITDFPDLPIKHIRLKENSGLINALNTGLRHATHPLIARMDSDDISLANRFELQLAHFYDNPKTDVLGGQIEEFSDNERQPSSIRRVPVKHKAIIKYMRHRCPFNHMTVIYRKRIFSQHTKYPNIDSMEDYAFWASLASAGCKFANLPEVIVRADASGLIQRRRGLKQLKSEWKLQKHLNRCGITNTPTRYFNFLTRGSIRILPPKMMKCIYDTFLRSRTID